MKNYILNGIIFCALMLCFSSQGFSGANSLVPPDRSGLFEALAKGKTVEMDSDNQFYLRGVIHKYVEQCGWPYPDSEMDAAAFVDASTLFSPLSALASPYGLHTSSSAFNATIGRTLNAGLNSARIGYDFQKGADALVAYI